MIPLPDDFNPAQNGIQVVQIDSLVYSYEITTMMYNGDERFVLSIMGKNNADKPKYYMIYSNDLNIYDIISQFEEHFKLNLVYIQDTEIPLNKVTHTPIKDYLGTFGPVMFEMVYID